MAAPEVPPVFLPPEATRHLRALIYASSPGDIITHLTLHATPPQITLSLSQTPPLTALYHTPHPTTPPNKNFLTEFPLTATYTPPLQEITLSTTLPNITHTLSAAHPLPHGALADTTPVTLLTTGTSRSTHGLVTLAEGVYHPLTSAPPTGRGVVGAWGRDRVSLSAALLSLGRFLYRRSRRIRVDGSDGVKKDVVLLCFGDGGVTVRRGSIVVSGVRRWVCRMPLHGGVGRFVPVDMGGFGREGGSAVERGLGNERVQRGGERVAERGSARRGEVRRRRRRTDVRSDVRNRGRSEREAAEGAEEEFMVFRMKEFDFGAGSMERVGGGEDADSGNDIGVTGVRHSGVDESDDTGPSELRVLHVDLDELANTTISTTTTTTSSSDSEHEEAMLETLCKQYLNQGYLERVEDELARR